MIDQLQSLRPEERPQKEPRVMRIDSESATTALDAIASETAREILSHLHEEPSPTSELAEALDTSIANVNYHLEKLESEGLVTEVDTWYSEKGREMRVYAPVEDPLVFSGTTGEQSAVRRMLGRAGAALLTLVLASLAVQVLVSEVLTPPAVSSSIRKATSAGALDGVAISPIPAGLLFFSGGTFALAAMLTVWYVRG